MSGLFHLLQHADDTRESVDSDPGSVTLKKEPSQSIPGGKRMRFKWAVLWLLLAAFTLAQDRLPIPMGPEVTRAEAQLKELFKAEYLKTKPAERLALSSKLLDLAKESTNDPAARYVLLREARDLSAKAGNADLAFKAAEELIAVYAVGNESRTAVADLLAAAPYSTTAAAQTADTLLSLGDTAKAADDWEAALAFYKAAELVARKTQNPPILVNAQQRLKQAVYYKAEAAKLKDYLATLKQSPDDPAANLGAGRFYCLLRGDWLNGTSLLIKGSDEKLKTAAKKDLQAGGGTFNDMLVAADAWYDLLSNAEPALKPAIQARALFWYTAAEPTITGLDKVKVTKRLAELATQGDARAAKLWVGISKALEKKLLKKWDTVGGAFAKKTFEELPEKPAILIGFNFMVAEGRPPSVIQPIFLTSQGELKGKIYGTPKQGEMPVSTKAKPGYAVGAIYTRGGGGIDAVQPIYMRLNDRGVDPNDKYEGPFVGGKGGGEATFGGDGNLILGIHGKIEDNGKISAISPISIDPNAGK
jgi:hypothetical protein